MNEEEFYNLCQAYRHWPVDDQAGVLDRYNELLAYVRRTTGLDRRASFESECG